MNTEQKTDAILILCPRIEDRWVHFDWLYFVDGECVLRRKSTSTLSHNEQGPLFPSFRYNDVAEWLISDDKKKYREYALKNEGFCDMQMSVDLIKENDVSSYWYERTWAPEAKELNIIDVYVFNAPSIDPRNGEVWNCPPLLLPCWNQPEINRYLPHCSKGSAFKIKRRRMADSAVISRLPWLVKTREACLLGIDPRRWMECKQETVFLSGDRFKAIKELLYLKGPDPRAFLYEKKERIRKSQIVTFISRRIRKISKIRPVSKSEKFFFQSLIGIKRLMDLVAA
jgi:hypothetical protein